MSHLPLSTERFPKLALQSFVLNLMTVTQTFLVHSNVAWSSASLSAISLLTLCQETCPIDCYPHGPCNPVCTPRAQKALGSYVGVKGSFSLKVPFQQKPAKIPGAEEGLDEADLEARWGLGCSSSLKCQTWVPRRPAMTSLGEQRRRWLQEPSPPPRGWGTSPALWFAWVCSVFIFL